MIKKECFWIACVYVDSSINVNIKETTGGQNNDDLAIDITICSRLWAYTYIQHT